MAEYRRPRHRTVARILAALDATVLMQSHCCFGGGTRIALELDEYRESEDIDFLCSDLGGYRALRGGIGERSLGAIMPAWPAGIALLRDVRADQYGIRTVACAKLRHDAAYRKHCAGNLAISDTKTLAAGLRKLEKLALAMP